MYCLNNANQMLVDNTNHRPTVGRERPMPGMAVSRLGKQCLSGMFFEAIKQSVGKALSVGKGLSRLDFT